MLAVVLPSVPRAAPYLATTGAGRAQRHALTAYRPVQLGSRPITAQPLLPRQLALRRWLPTCRRAAGEAEGQEVSGSTDAAAEALLDAADELAEPSISGGSSEEQQEKVDSEAAAEADGASSASEAPAAVTGDTRSRGAAAASMLAAGLLELLRLFIIIPLRLLLVTPMAWLLGKVRKRRSALSCAVSAALLHAHAGKPARGSTPNLAFVAPCRWACWRCGLGRY